MLEMLRGVFDHRNFVITITRETASVIQRLPYQLSVETRSVF